MMSHAAMPASFLILLAMALLAVLTMSDDVEAAGNSDESKVPPYTLPDLLTAADGSKVTDGEGWKKRRAEILELYRTHMQGRDPGRPAGMAFEVTSTDPKALGGIATRKEIAIRISAEPDAPIIHVLLYLPNAAKGPSPVFVNVNFDGNHTIHADPGITIREQRVWNNKEKKEELVKPAEATRGKSIGAYSLETVLGRGYGLATIARANIEPDYAEGWKHGIRGYLLKKSGKETFATDDWGAVAAWAWGLSRTLDYLETDPAVDAKRAIVMGHSRMGKAALWAGAQDERFAIVISNNSGEGGAALAKRFFGETTADLNSRFPHWFCANFKPFSNNEAAMPFDAHMLLALAAPRPLYVASADEDKWADPKGEFLSAQLAGAVYKLFGKEGVGAGEWPALDKPVGNVVGYHVRTGKHDVLPYDWEQYLAFADRHFGRAAK